MVLDPIDAEPFARADRLLRDSLGERRASEARARGHVLEPEQTDVLVDRVLAGDEAAAPPTACSVGASARSSASSRRA